MATKVHPPELRAQAVAELLTGATVAETARKYGVDRTTVMRWRGLVTTVAHEKGKADLERLGERIFALVEQYIETLLIQARWGTNEAWLDRQNAHDLAIMHGVISDKAVRLLNAIRPVNTDRQEQ